MTPQHVDRFDREDGEVGASYVVPCGEAAIFDESVWPVSPTGGDATAFEGTTRTKTQVLLNEELDSPDAQAMAVWSHLESLPAFGIDIDELMSRATSDPSFTILARMTKDPLLVDLGVAEDPNCYNQGYGLRVTCPRDGSAPVLKLIKLTPRGLPPGVPGPSTPSEPDGALVLASVTLTSEHLNVADSEDFPPSYRGLVQALRLRIRRTDDVAILEAWSNDATIQRPLLKVADIAHPVWGAAGLAGFEFLSATLGTQPEGASQFSTDAIPVMSCHMFQAETVADIAPTRASTPKNLFTYGRVVDRVVLLVEKNGDSRYTATAAGQTKRDAYLGFVVEAEKDILREEGFYRWLWRERDIILAAGFSDVELPEDLGELGWITPKGYTGPVLTEVSSEIFQRRLAGRTGAGFPSVYVRAPSEVNNRTVVRLFPSPSTQLMVTVGYYARCVYPDRPDEQIPNVPQEDIDVLIYSAAAHAALIDTNLENSQMLMAIAEKKKSDLRTKNNRNLHGYRSVIRHVSDVDRFPAHPGIPLLRSTQLGHLL